jgi:hypothetical protein
MVTCEEVTVANTAAVSATLDSLVQRQRSQVQVQQVWPPINPHPRTEGKRCTMRTGGRSNRKYRQEWEQEIAETQCTTFYGMDGCRTQNRSAATSTSAKRIHGLEMGGESSSI